MKQIKIFSSVSPKKLESDVNKHIVEYDKLRDVIDIRYNTYVNEHGVDTWTAMVIYEL